MTNMTNMSAMTTALDGTSNTAETIAIQAASIAFVLGRNFAAEPIVLHAENYADVHASVRIALEATASPRHMHPVLEINAEHITRGARILNHSDIERSHKLIVVSTVSANEAIDERMQGPVLANLTHGIDSILRERRSNAVLRLVILEDTVDKSEPDQTATNKQPDNDQMARIAARVKRFPELASDPSDTNSALEQESANSFQR